MCLAIVYGRALLIYCVFIVTYLLFLCNLVHSSLMDSKSVLASIEKRKLKKGISR